MKENNRNSAHFVVGEALKQVGLEKYILMNYLRPTTSNI